ncbi:MAG: biotin/lipoyl-binding protein [Flavobacteriaceae bacterium]|nr:biotin/lipoyl-binding protein [Flavobacteriaceae bacterium]
MNSKYKLKVNQTFDFEFTDEEISNFDLIKRSPRAFHVLSNKVSIEAELISSDFNSKNYVIKIGSNSYSVKIENEIDQLIDRMGFSANASKQIDKIKAPMPGLILDINVIEGQEVKEDDPLLILEAMKMENVINAPRSGKIKSISATKGEAVEKNTLLIEFE